MKTEVIMVIRFEQYQRGMTIEDLKCRADLNFESFEFWHNSTIGTIVTKWALILFG